MNQVNLLLKKFHPMHFSSPYIVSVPLTNCLILRTVIHFDIALINGRESRLGINFKFILHPKALGEGKAQLTPKALLPYRLHHHEYSQRLTSKAFKNTKWRPTELITKVIWRYHSEPPQ